MRTFLYLFADIAKLAAVQRLAAEDVEVMYKDGMKDRGEWGDSNADKVTLRMKMGGNSVDIQIPWSKFVSLSNGLTRETALKKWIEAHKDKLCDTCGGDRQ